MTKAIRQITSLTGNALIEAAREQAIDAEGMNRLFEGTIAHSLLDVDPAVLREAFHHLKDGSQMSGQNADLVIQIIEQIGPDQIATIAQYRGIGL